MNTLVENQHGHGGRKGEFDIRDHKVSGLGMAPFPFDWNKGFDIETLVGKIPTEDQGQSFSCGGQSLRYYLEVLEAITTKSLERRSARYSYSQIWYPGGGTTIRDIGKIGAQQGVSLEMFYSSYENGHAPSEAFMRLKGGITDEIRKNAQTSRKFGYAMTGKSIESIAQAIRDNYGCIIRINGQNNGTWLSSYPLPPQETEWSHFVYAGKVKMVNGKKYIGIKNSWGAIGENNTGWQWLGEDYFTTGNVCEGIVFYDKEVTPYTPTIPQQITPTWLQQFMTWISRYTLPYLG